MSSKIGIIIGREYLERVRKKSFIITTLLMPLFMLAMMVAPALIMQFSKSDLRTIAVIDRTGFIAPQLESDEETLFVPMASVELDSALAMTELSGVVYIAEGGGRRNRPGEILLQRPLIYESRTFSLHSDRPDYRDPAPESL